MQYIGKSSLVLKVLNITVLTALSLAASVFYENRYLLYLISGFIFLESAFLMYNELINKKKITVNIVMGSALGLGYTTSIVLNPLGGRDYGISYAVQQSGGPLYVGYSLSVLIIYFTFLIGTGYFQSGFDKYEAFGVNFNKFNIGCLSVYTIFASYLLYEGYIGFGGIQTTTYRSVSPLASLTYSMIIPFTVFSFYVYKSAKNKVYKWMGLSCFCILIVTIILFGRRDILFTLTIVSSIYTIGKTINTWNVTKFAVATAAVVTISSVLFVGMREANRRSENLGPFEFYSEAVDIYRSGLPVFDIIGSNIYKRGNLLAYTSSIISNEKKIVQNRPSVLYHSLIKSTPSIIIDKDEYDVQSEEQIVAINTEIRYTDYPNTLITSGFTDFGILGVFFYITLIASILNIIAYLFRGKSNIFSFLSLAFVLHACLLLEGELFVYFARIRDLILSLSIMYTLYLLAKFIK